MGLCTLEERRRGIGVILGGILIHLTLGNIYSFGNMMTYMTSFMHSSVDKNINYGNFIWVNAITTGSQGLFMVLGGILEKKIGPKLTCFLGSLMLSCGIGFTYFTIKISLIAVIATYGLISGIGISLAYVIPMACAMKWFPDKKGLVNGLIVGGFGLGALGSTTFQTLYLNPKNIAVGKSGYFEDPIILSKVPEVFVLLAIIFITMQAIGCLLICKPKPRQLDIPGTVETQVLLSDSEDEEIFSKGLFDPRIAERDLSPKEILYYKEFYILWFIYFFNTFAIGYINALYKSFGQTFIKNDLFLSQVGSFAAIFNCCGRLFWGRLMDKSSFKVSMLIVSTLLTLCFLTLPATSLIGKAAFAIWIWTIFFTFSGTFVLMATVTEKVFGSRHYAANYGLVFTSQIASGPLVALSSGIMLQYFGYSGCSLMTAFIVSGSIYLTCFLPKRL